MIVRSIVHEVEGEINFHLIEIDGKKSNCFSRILTIIYFKWRFPIILSFVPEKIVVCECIIFSINENPARELKFSSFTIDFLGI